MPATGCVILTIVASNPRGVSGDIPPERICPTFKLATCAGTGGFQVSVPLTSAVSAASVAAVSCTVFAPTLICGPLGAVAGPYPCALCAATENSKNLPVVFSPPIVAGEAVTVVRTGGTPGADTQVMAPVFGSTFFTTCCVVIR